MMRGAWVLIRLRRRVRRPIGWMRWAGNVVLAVAVVLAYLSGGLLRALLPATIGPTVASRIVPGLALLLVGILSVLVGIGSTAGSLWRDAQDETTHLLGLPVTVGDVAIARLGDTLLDGLRAGVVAALLTLSAAVGTWGGGIVLPWLPPLAVSAGLEILVCTALGSLAVLLFGRLVPPRRREIVLLGVLIVALVGASALVVRLGMLVARSRLAEVGSLLKLLLAPMRAAIRLYHSQSPLQIDALFYAGAFLVAAALLLGACARSWTRLLRADLAADARPRPQADRPSPVPARVIGAESGRRREGRLDRIVRSLPAPAGAVLARDLRLMTRVPAVRIRAILLIATLLIVSSTKLPLAWALLMFYFAPCELARDALLRSIEEERENHFFLRVLVPQFRRYLRLRVLASFLVVFPLCALSLAAVSAMTERMGADPVVFALRLGLLAAASWLAPISALAAATLTGSGEEGGGTASEASPAMFPLLASGAVVAGTCVLIDRAVVSGRIRADGALPTSTPGGLLAGALLLAAVALTPVFLRLLARRWERWSDA